MEEFELKSIEEEKQILEKLEPVESKYFNVKIFNHNEEIYKEVSTHFRKIELPSLCMESLRDNNVIKGIVSSTKDGSVLKSLMNLIKEQDFSIKISVGKYDKTLYYYKLESAKMINLESSILDRNSEESVYYTVTFRYKNCLLTIDEGDD